MTTNDSWGARLRRAAKGGALLVALGSASAVTIVTTAVASGVPGLKGGASASTASPQRIRMSAS